MQSWAVAFAAAGLKYFLTGFIPLAQGGVNWAPLIAKSGVFKIHVRQPALVSNLAEFSWVCWPSQTSQAHLLTCPDLRIDWLVSLFVCFFFKFLFLYLAVLGLSCGTQHHLLWHVGLAPWPGIKPPSLPSPAWAGGVFTTSATWEAPSASQFLLKAEWQED